MWSQEKYAAALKYAAQAHSGQLVPGSELPYVVHVATVAAEVMRALQAEAAVNGNLAVQCALLHDVIEDAGKSYTDLAKAFGREVAEGVLALTKSNVLKSKSERMADSIARIKVRPPEIGMVKLADRIVNLQPPPAHWSAEKIADYREEAKLIHQELKASSAYLADRLLQKIADYEV
jgi:guanosine-3',5'-bis(diphosphate) 3'-pyrophosphohydrolase